MKIFWVINADEDLPHRCFFRLTRAEAQWDVDFRVEAAKENEENGIERWPGIWEIEEEEVPDHLFGHCINSPEPHKPALPTCPDCSVGMIRKMRNGTENDNGTCGSCPYYLKVN